jgi:uncharacterized protein (DUF697 family)
MVWHALVSTTRKNGANMAQETPESSGTAETHTVTPVGPGTAEMTDSARDELALQLVDRLSLWSGAAGLIPLPLVDVAAVGGVQFYMLRRLSEIYGVPFSDNRGRSILASVAGAVIPASASTSVIKTLPGIGTVIGALTMPVVSAGATWVIGKLFIQHFASGGTLLDFNPSDYREFIKEQSARFAARSGAVAPTPETPARPVASDAAPAAPGTARRRSKTPSA